FLVPHPALHSFPTRRSSDLLRRLLRNRILSQSVRRHPAALVIARRRRASALRSGFFLPIPPCRHPLPAATWGRADSPFAAGSARSEEHTSELQSRENLVCRL